MTSPRTPNWRRYLRFWRSSVAADVDDELRFHSEMRAAEYIARGMSQADARDLTAARLGDVAAARAECIELGELREQEARRADFLEALAGDVRFAFRSMCRTPGWTLVALLTIALGVGATTTVFRVADALIVRPFSYPHASRVFIARRQFDVDGQAVPVPVPVRVVREWRASARSIEAAAPYTNAGLHQLGDGGATAAAYAVRVDTAFLAFAGAGPLIGRNFTSAELVEGNELRDGTALMITEPFWRRQFGSSPDVIGAVMRLDGISVTIVGVVSASVLVPDFRVQRADVLLPIALDGAASVLVRLRRGVSPKVAAGELDGILRRANIADLRPVPGEMPLHLSRPQDWLDIRTPLVMLAGAAALLLLVACTNVAHLLLARGAARERELAVRHALGAGRARLVRQLVTEAVLLGAAGGVLAIVVGWVALAVLTALRPASVVALTYVSADSRLAWLAAAIAIASGLAVGVLAGLRTARRDVGLALRASTSSSTSGARRLRSWLVVGEVAISLTLLVGALLLTHTVFDLQRRNLGFDARNLYEIRVEPFRLSPTSTPGVPAALRQRLASVPGFQGAVLASSAPGPRGWRMLAVYESPGHEIAVNAVARRASWGSATAVFSVAPGYFSLLGMPILLGRGFDAASHARNEVIVSATLARTLGGTKNVIGKQLRNAVPKTRGEIEPWQTVVGVVPDVVTNLVDRDDGIAIYKPIDPVAADAPVWAGVVVARIASTDVEQLGRVLAATVDAHSKLDVSSVRAAIDVTLAESRFTMEVLAAFAVLGLVLAAVGLFGVISYSVGQRTREIGVRMTLGATRGSIARLVVGDGVRLGIAGIAVGLFGAAFASRLVVKLLYGVPRLDPFAFGVAVVVLLSVCVVACIIPMLRSTGVDPVIAVRAE